MAYVPNDMRMSTVGTTGGRPELPGLTLRRLGTLAHAGKQIGCNGKKAGTMKEPLSHTHPELLTEWHPTKNGD